MKRTVFRNRWLPYLLVLPHVAVTLVFFLWPAFDSLRLSLFKASPFGDRQIFVGLENFRRLLFAPDYHRSILNSFVFASGVTGLGLLIALFVAFLASQRIHGLSLDRAVPLWPYGIPLPVAGIISPGRTSPPFSWYALSSAGTSIYGP